MAPQSKNFRGKSGRNRAGKTPNQIGMTTGRRSHR